MALADYIAFATVAYALNEASGSAIDDVGSLDLTDNNTCGAGTGKLGGSRTFNGSNESLSHAADAAYGVGTGDWGIYFWMKANAAGTLIANEDGTGNRNWQLYFDGTNITLYGFDSTTPHTATATTFGALSTGTWYHVSAWYDKSDSKSYIAVNGGAADSSDVFTQNSVDGTTFRLGARSDGNNWFNGELDEVVILKGSYLPSTERTDLYNGGTGVAFANWAGGGGDAVPQVWMQYRQRRAG